MDNQSQSEIKSKQESQASVSEQATVYLFKPTVLLKNAWAIYKQRIWTFLGIMIIPASISLFSSGFAYSTAFFSFFIVLFFGLFLSIQLWAGAALIYAIKDRRENIGVVEAYRRAWRKIISYAWIEFLTAFVVMLGFFFFIVPGVIFAIWFSFAGFILISENLKGMNALLKSKEYVRGRWGSVCLRILFIGVVVLIPITILSAIPFFEHISSLVAVLFLTPLTSTYLFLLYNNLKALKGEDVKPL